MPEEAGTSLEERLRWPGPPLAAGEYHRAARMIADASTVTPKRRVAVLASHTLTVVKPHLSVEFSRVGVPAEIFIGPFGQFEQLVLDASSGLWSFGPDALVLSLRIEDSAPDAVFRPRSSPTAFADAAAAAVDRLTDIARGIRSRSSAPILVANFAAPAVPTAGVLDANFRDSSAEAFHAANLRLREALQGVPGTFIWDYAGLVAAQGAANWTDERLWYVGRIAVAGAHHGAFAAHLARSLRAALVPPAKCLVLDLDNTLWGGVLGDDGIEGIQIGDDHPGNAFKALQRHALALRDRGILLAVASKNDEDLVERAFREHPEMLLRWEHLAAVRANWRPKSGNLREIAEELNIGVDALVFLDDNPVERVEVRAGCPGVHVVEVPHGRSLLAALQDVPYFDTAMLSAEDAIRPELYRQDRERRQFESAAGDVSTFLDELAMSAAAGPVTDVDAARVVQLIGKTNQFNLTTRRHNQSTVAAFRADADTLVAQLRLSDRFGDQGLVVVAVLRREDADAVIDTFLMSCRVMNRRVEHAMMALLAEQARTWNCDRLIGEFLPTPRNGMVAEFYPSMGFAPLEAGAEGVRRYALPLDAGTLSWPTAIRRVNT